jgi:protein-tyrosine-phosphatase
MEGLMSAPPSVPDNRLLAGVARLAARHQGTFSAETVQAVLVESYDLLADEATVREHLVVLAERFAAQRLNALAHAHGAPGVVPRVLFVCAGNSGRSQLAAALLAHRAQGRIAVHSAGTDPAPALEQHVATVLAEVGIAVDDAFPKPITDDVVSAADVVITMGCGEVCPVLPGRRYLDWPVPDPAGASMDAVCAIRDDLDTRTAQLLAELLPEA